MNRPLRILYSSHFGTLHGGGQKSIHALLKKIDKKKFQVFLTCPEDGALAASSRNERVSVDITDLPTLRIFNLFGILKALVKLRRIIKNWNIDLIHTDSSRQTLYLGIIAWMRKIPLISHARVSSPEPPFYERCLCHLSNKIIAVSDGAGRRYSRFKGHEKKVEVIFNAVDVKEFHPRNDGTAFRDEIGVNDEIVVGLIGQLHPIKGQDLFLRAAAKVLKEEKRIKFFMIGKDYEDYKARLENVITELTLSEHVCILPFRENMTEVMAGLDILVNASTLEGFSRVIIEAMSSGKAVIAADVGGNPDAVMDGYNGYLFPSGDSDKLAEIIKSLIISDQLRIEMGANGRKAVEEKFDIEKQVHSIEKLYQSVMTKNNSINYDQSKEDIQNNLSIVSRNNP